MVVVTEVAIGVTVLGYFLSPHITKLMEVAQSCAYSQYKLHTGTVEKLLKLAEDLEDIKRCFLDPATMGGFVNDQRWLDSLWNLKDDIHEAEEILDLFESHILELEAAKNLKKRGGSSSKKSTDTSSSQAPSVKRLDKVLKNLEVLRPKANELRENPNTRQDVLSPISGRSAAAMGHDPVRDKKLFFGYKNEYDQLVTMLRDSNTEKKVVAIIGHGGMGKTELARQAFRDVKNEFDLPIWVPAYGKNTQLSLLEEIWKSADNEVLKSVSEMNISSLQNALRELLKSKKCLLVLDDVWSDEQAINENQRKHALQCFTDYVSAGSRIVITTRANICSTALRLSAEADANATIVLNGIGDTQVSLLLNDRAKLGGDSPLAPKIQRLLKEQLPKLKGSPSAAIEIGDELAKQKGQTGCCEILGDIKKNMGSVFSGHYFTYQHLPPHLQRCFAFCSIFPDNWRFEPEKLAKMWMALGFVEESSHDFSSSRMEDVARGYFESLVDRSLFHSIEEASSSSSMGEGDKQTYYVIHEQIHWMLRLASTKNCISISGDSSSHSAPKKGIPASVRHLSVTRGCLNQLKAYSIGLSKLRTLLVLKDDDGSNVNPAPSIDKNILREFKGVRVLDLTETGITQLPENIGELKHVRYLGLPGTISSDLCDEVTKLLFLQTLSVGDKKKKDYIANISGIGRLSKLRESIEFQVMRGSEKDGHTVSELAGMNSLGETLTIKGLDAVASKEEAEEAGLGTKLSVKILKLEWGPLNARQGSSAATATAAADPAAAVLEGLQPHRYIHELRITRYPGETSPASTWLSRMEKLARLYLQNCRKLKALPALGGLQCLELLVIKEFTAVERINGDLCGGGAFQKLKKIVLDDMPKLVAWDDMPRDAFPQLRDVSIVDCPKLSSLSGLGCCGGPIRLSVRGCALITLGTLPAKFRDGVSSCKFH